MGLTDPALELAWRPFCFRLPQELVTAHGALVEKRGWLLKLTAADGRLGWGEAAPLQPQAPGAGAAQPAGCPGPGFQDQRSQGESFQGQSSPSKSTPSPDSQGAKGQRQTPVGADGEPEARLGVSGPAAPLAPGARPPSGPGVPNAAWASPQGHGACAAAIAALGPRLGRQQLERALPQLPGPLAFALGLALAELDGLGSEAQGGWLVAPPSAELLPAGAGALTALEALLHQKVIGLAASPGDPGAHPGRSQQPPGS
jgi:hypothetical protein